MTVFNKISSSKRQAEKTEELVQPRQKKVTVRLVASHMTHAADTAKRFYQHLQGEKECDSI